MTSTHCSPEVRENLRISLETEKISGQEVGPGMTVAPALMGHGVKMINQRRKRRSRF